MFMGRKIVLLWLLTAAMAVGAQTLPSIQQEYDTLTGRARNLSPMQYGFDTASDGVQRYWALYNTHLAARQAGVDVDYSALADRTVELTLPADAPDFIPLTQHNDFKNVLFYVLDTVADRYLFRMGDDNYTLIDVDARWVDSGDFRSVPQLAKGMHLLILNDDNPWVAERIGFGEPAMRRDVLWVVDGVSRNRVVASYQTEATKMKCYEVPVTDEPKTIYNLHLRRHAGSTHKLCLFSVYFENNVNVYNVSVFTPQSKSFRHVNAAAELVAQCQGTQQPPLQDAGDCTKTRLLSDAAIYFQSSTNIHCRDIYVDGTYSIPGRNGYAISANNTWNATFEHVVADGNWGVFGNNNMSMTVLKDCDVNRFDIHCYGRDVLCKGCTFRKKQIQFSSLYGTLQFDSCSFVDCIPVRIRSSYNAYTPFDIVVNHCTLLSSTRHHQLVNVMLKDTARNSRPELSERCLPNVRINGLTVEQPWFVRHFDIYQPTGTTKLCRQPFDYLSNVTVDSLRIVTPRFRMRQPKVRITTVPAATLRPLTVQADGLLRQTRKGLKMKPPKLNIKLTSALPEMVR